MKNILLNTFGWFVRQNLFSYRMVKISNRYELRLNPFPFVTTRKTLPFQILVYHRVIPYEDPFSMAAITQRMFNDQMKILSSYFRVISLDQLYFEIKNNEIQPGTVVVTFDDGYRDNFLYAFPILKAYKIPATIFLTTNYIESHKMLWHDKVLFAIRNSKVKKIKFNSSPNSNFDFSSDKNKHLTVFMLLEYLKKFPPKIRDKKIMYLIDFCKVNELSSDPLMLNWSEVKKMYTMGISFGSHTNNHTILSTISAHEQKEEIYRSKELIENMLNNKIIAFAYPNGKSGDYTEVSKKFLNAAGYKMALTTQWGLNTASQDLFELLRISFINHNKSKFLGNLLAQRIIF